jgi:hypothetical protein
VKNKLEVVPNPASSIISIETPAKGYVLIHNINGQEVLHQEIIELITILDVSKWVNSVYIVQLVEDKGVRFGTFIKQ